MDLTAILIFLGWCFGLPGLAILMIWRGWRKGAVEKRCPGCDCGLTTARAGLSCPACGKLAAIFLSRRSDPDRVLCRGCDHDLAGLEWNADCPECGLLSAAMPHFEHRRPRYPLKSLLGGMLLIGWLGATLLLMNMGSSW